MCVFKQTIFKLSKEKVEIQELEKVSNEVDEKSELN